MKNYLNEVLKACIELARKGESNIKVFDLMYETSLAYPELKDILDKLVLNNELEVIDIKTYKFIGDINQNIEVLKPKYKPISSSKSKQVSDKEHSAVDSKHENSERLSAEERAQAERRAYLEMRRQELIRRMQAEMEQDNEDDEEDNNDEGEEEIDEDELRYKALKLCIEKNYVSVSMFQRSFPIGYIRACKLVDWMENMGYISVAEDSKPRKVLITKAEFEEMFLDEDDFDELFDELDLPDAEEDDDEQDKNSKLDYLQPAKGVDAKNLQKAIDFLKGIMVNSKDSNNDYSEEFVQFFSERAALLIASDLNMSRVAAIKKAKLALEDVRNTGNETITAVYERIVSELQNMSNYYYIKIKAQLSQG